jgi:hypothetical protein
MPAHLQVACTPKPMRLAKTTMAFLPHRCPYCSHVQRRHRSHQTPALPCLHGPHQRGCSRQPLGCIVQTVRFSLAATTLFFHGLELSGFVTAHLPIRVTSSRPSHCQVPRPTGLVRERPCWPTAQVTGLQRDRTPLQRCQGGRRKPKRRCDPQAAVPTQPSAMAPQRRLGTAASGQQDPLTRTRSAALRCSPYVLLRLTGRRPCRARAHATPRAQRARGRAPPGG